MNHTPAPPSVSALEVRFGRHGECQSRQDEEEPQNTGVGTNGKSSPSFHLEIFLKLHGNFTQPTTASRALLQRGSAGAGEN